MMATPHDKLIAISNQDFRGKIVYSTIITGCYGAKNAYGFYSNAFFAFCFGHPFVHGQLMILDDFKQVVYLF